jgi:hypothetical protein
VAEWNALTDESRARWDRIAQFWDDYMGEHSNRFHREIVRPSTERLLEVKEGDEVLDIAATATFLADWRISERWLSHWTTVRL